MEVGALSFLSVEGVCKGEWVCFSFGGVEVEA